MSRGTILTPREAIRKKGYCGDVYELIGPSNSGAKSLDCALVEIEAGGRSQAHKHTIGEELYLVVSGSGTVWVGELSARVAKGSAVHIPAGEIHVIANDSDQLMELFVVNIPPYDENDVAFEES